MAIVQTISTLGQFRNAFEQAGRRNQFSRDALGLLFDYFDSVDDNVELDVVAICCEFAESTADEVRDSYDVLADTSVDDFLSDNTTLIGQTDAGAFVYVQF
jgi:hypothetical protein